MTTASGAAAPVENWAVSAGELKAPVGSASELPTRPFLTGPATRDRAPRDQASAGRRWGALRARRRALREIDAAIERLQRGPRSSVRVLNTWMPKRITWYECPRCGWPAAIDGERKPYCTACGVSAVAHTWTRPDRERHASRIEHWREIRGANTWKPLPDGEYRIMRRTGTED